eukprot:Tamp_15466.p1 GENE.Tamp_15466~~Tamp_15466.p1  ORF type:complete len:385 (-),score=22.06 Tamp_15466:277-1431(-)
MPRNLSRIVFVSFIVIQSLVVLCLLNSSTRVRSLPLAPITSYLIHNMSDQLTPKQINEVSQETFKSSATDLTYEVNKRGPRPAGLTHGTTQHENKCPAFRGTPRKSHMFFSSCKGQRDKCLRLGTAYGGHEIPHPLCWLRPGDIYYGFGCGEDISFDISMAHAYDLQVRLFDPTPRAVDHVQAVFNALKYKQIPSHPPKSAKRNQYLFGGLLREISGGVDATSWFDNVINCNVSLEKVGFNPWALAVEDGNMSFFEPLAGVSHSLLSKSDLSGGDQNRKLTVPARELRSIMAEMRDGKISILKIDIEGYEIHLIPALVTLFRDWEYDRWPRILMFDMDSMRPGHQQMNIREGQKCVKLLLNAGYEVFSSESYDYTFVLKLYQPV